MTALSCEACVRALALEPASHGTVNPHTRYREAAPKALAAHAATTVAPSAAPESQRLDLMVGTNTKGRREFPVDPESYVPLQRYVRVLLITARSRTRLKGNTIVSTA